MTQCAGGMAHDGDCLAGGDKGLEQFDRVLVFCQVPHRAMAARVKDGVEVFLSNTVEANGLVEVSFRLFILFKSQCQFGTELGLVALGIQWRSAALWGGERDLNARILENVIGRRKLLEPETRLSSSVAQLIVGRD